MLLRRKELKLSLAKAPLLANLYYIISLDCKQDLFFFFRWWGHYWSQWSNMAQ